MQDVVFPHQGLNDIDFTREKVVHVCQDNGFVHLNQVYLIFIFTDAFQKVIVSTLNIRYHLLCFLREQLMQNYLCDAL